MRRLILLVLFLVASTSGAQEGIWEDALPLDPIDCVDGCTFTGTTTTEDLVVDGILDLGTVETFGISDQTPDVSSGSYWETSQTSVTINDFDGAGILDGQLLSVLSRSGEGTTYDCTSSGLLCGATDIVTRIGDMTFWQYDGTNWRLISWTDRTVDQSLSNYLPLAGGTMSGNIHFIDDVASLYGTSGPSGDARILHNDTDWLFTNTKGNLLIDPAGFTDFTGAIFVSENEDVYSRFGEAPFYLSPSDTIDMLVVRKKRTVNTGVRRAFTAILDLSYNTSNTGRQNYAFNAFVYTNEANDGGNTRTTGSGGATGGRYAFRHLGEGTFAMAGGVSSSVEITDDIFSDEDGTVTSAYAYLDEGGDGGAGSGEITDYYGMLIKNSVGNVKTKTGIYIEALDNGSVANIGIKIDEISTAALWFNSDTGTTNNGMFFGTGKDTNLYRSTDDTLKTDDDFIAVGLLTGSNLIECPADTKIIEYTDGTPACKDSVQTTIGAIDDGDILVGDTGSYRDVQMSGDVTMDKDGVVTLSPAFGHMFTNDTIALSIPDDQLPFEVGDTWTIGEVNDVTFGDEYFLTIEKNGMYSIIWNMSIHADAITGAAIEIEGYVMVDGTKYANGGQDHVTLSNIVRNSSIGAPVVINLTGCPGDCEEISLGITNETNGDDIDVEHANLFLKRIGGP